MRRVGILYSIDSTMALVSWLGPLVVEACDILFDYEDETVLRILLESGLAKTNRVKLTVYVERSQLTTPANKILESLICTRRSSLFRTYEG